MDAERLGKLNEAQRVCLRMVYMHLSSKDIARELGISPHTVDQRLKTAMAILGAESRVEAARLLARAEGAGTYPPLVYQPPDIAGVPLPAPSLHLDQGGAQSRPGHAMREQQAAFEAAMPESRSPMPLPLPLRGTRPYDLKPWQRLAWAVAIMVFVALAFGMFVSGVEALSRLGGR